MNDAHVLMDFKGFMEGYTQCFGGRTSRRGPVIGVSALANPRPLAEIEVVAVKEGNENLRPKAFERSACWKRRNRGRFGLGFERR
jgi:hypothetical protein